MNLSSLPPTSHPPLPTLFYSAGEVSGDLFASGLLKALKARCPELRAYGLGGPRLAAAGLCLLDDVRRLSAVGLSENLGTVPYMWGLKKRLSAWLRQHRPQAVILVDFQGLNLQLAEVAKGLGIPVIYFVAPQDWLWGFASGVRRIVKHVDLILSVFAPEAEFYRAKGAQVKFVGHPLRDLLPSISKAEAREQLGLTDSKTVICWMPGSRRHEVSRLLPVMKQIQRQIPPARHLLPVAADYLADGLSGFDAQQLSPEQRYLAMVASDAVIGASGSMVLEAALLARPVVAMYRVSPLTYAVASRVVKLPWITLPNILLQRSLVPEFIQHLSSQDIAETLMAELQQPQKWLQVSEELGPLLGPPGAYDRAADEIRNFLRAQ